MPKDQDLRFIRKHGRIIPIRINREKEARKRGLLLAGSGVGIAAGSGLAAAKLTDSAYKESKRAGAKLTRVHKSVLAGKALKRGFLERAIQQGAESRKNVLMKLSGAKAVFAAGTGLGAGFLTAGALRFISQEDRTKYETPISIGATTAGGILGHLAMRRFLKVKLPKIGG